MKPVLRKIRRVGTHSLSLLLPKEMAKELGIDVGDYVAVSLEDGKLTIRKVDITKLAE